jgi:hypothetical protein
MAKGDIHTVPRDAGWANEVEGGSRAIGLYDTKAEAERAGRDRAKGDHVEHLIHRRDGTIGERNTYKKDPFPPRG